MFQLVSIPFLGADGRLGLLTKSGGRRSLLHTLLAWFHPRQVCYGTNEMPRKVML